MTQDEIIETAVKAGMRREIVTMYENPELLEAFAKLVAKHEREACAYECVKQAIKGGFPADCAAAIRNRGNT
jgi:hypothetical protein